MVDENKKFQHWRLETDNKGVVWCYIDVKDSSTNILSAQVLTEFSDILDILASDQPSGLVILSAKSSGFIAGADIHEFVAIENADQALTMLKRGQSIYDKLDALACPTLSLINGFCLGGGMEMALACDYRIALEDDNTRLGLPEVLLGIHPGYGGSMRLVRLIGPIRAIPLMLQGRTVDARQAKKLGIVDYVVPDRLFIKSATDIIKQKPTPRRAGLLPSLVNKTPIRQFFAKFLRMQTAKKIKQDHYPAPFALINVWEKYGGNDSAMLNGEVNSVAQLAVKEASRNLVRVYLLQQRLKSFGVSRDFKPAHVHVFGAGVMGGDIAAWCALRGMTVGLQDREPKYIAPAIKRAYTLFKRKLKHPRRVQAVMDRLIPTINSAKFEKVDVIIEAIIEDTNAKTELFKELEGQVRDDAILATNTSSIPLETISKSLKAPERLVGIHFFNPVARMQLVEVVSAENTSPECFERAATFCKKIGRLPLPVKSSPGFLVNRILTPYLMEAMLMYEEGIKPELIDKAAVEFGMPMGPVELADTVGLDICLSVAKNLSERIDIKIPEKLVNMVEQGKLGKKKSKGFYQYKKGKPVKEKVISNSSSLKDIEQRLVMIILNESIACLGEGIVEDEDLLDAGMIFGTGFAPFRGGPMNYAKTRGYETVYAELSLLHTTYGDRFEPSGHWQKYLTH